MGGSFVVASGKGGAGKSTVTVGLGYALAKRGQSVLLIDGDAGLRSLDIMLGIENDIVYNLADIFEGKCEPVKAIYSSPHCENLYILPAPTTLDQMCTPDDMRRLCNGFSLYFDYVIVDSPAGIGTGFECAMTAARSGIIVSTPDLVCARSAHIVSNIMEERGIPSRLIVNRLKKTPILTGRMPGADDVIDTVGVQLIGIIPEDEELLIATANGRPFPLNSTASLCFDNIAARMLGTELPLANLERM